ncbi:AAA family ATPase [Pseudomonas putida]|uniref:AAA family ATPase n=1 Tax=Pseudomonas putida TaxID=303 RepID=UPI0004CEE078|nr:ATP-binding protein [Pseudomonas putida]
MASAAHDYQHFVRWLHEPALGASPDARRFGNLVLQHFAAISLTSRNRSQRAIRLVELARNHFLAQGDNLPVLDAIAAGGGWPWRSLTELTIGPFRGFRHPEPFDLSKRLVLFYGPNGSGKTSLCEALEYALLGAVDEGAQKRIDAEQYLRNVHERRYAAPQLIARDEHGQSVAVVADADAFRFCFIEKNRIDSFSRIAAKPAGQKTELIAALFGMDDFNEFVGQFNESLNEQLSLVPVRGQQLNQARQAIAADLAVTAGEPMMQAELERAEQHFIQERFPGLTYFQLQQAVGFFGEPGRLQELDGILNQPAPIVYGLRQQDLLSAYQRADAAHEEVESLSQQIAAHGHDLAFQGLYAALQSLQVASPDRCPACDTSLQGQPHVHTNPYEKAARGLEGLRELTSLQQRYQAALAQRRAASDGLSSYLANFALRVGATADSPYEVCRYLVNPGVVAETAWWKLGYNAPAGAKSMAQLACDWALQLEQTDAVTQQNLNQRQQLIHERERLTEARIVLAEHVTRRQQVRDSVVAARARINTFEADNALLIQQAEVEGQVIAGESRIQHAYDEFLGLLRRYRSDLPGTLMAGLNASAMELYNEFNVRDAEEDKLVELHFPLTGADRIQLSFRGDPQRRVDALQVLSEGHVRCLGLAILLAKASSIQAPTVIFDDAINAIDHEHRQGIREALFESERFANTQVIVTCHSNEFIKDIQNHVAANQWVAYTLLHHQGNYHPRVIRNVPPQAYLILARAAVDRGDHRAALQSSRQALEMLTLKIWKWLGRCGLGLLTAQLSRDGDQPGLSNLCGSICSKLRTTPTFEHADKQPLIDSLAQILGIGEQNLIWTYLNKGTHEEMDRDDFDAGQVELVVELLEAINALRMR